MKLNTAQQILELITPFVIKGNILPRTYMQINNNISDFVVLERSGTIIACAGLKNCQESNVGEIYALAVSREVQNQGISIKLLDRIMQKAQYENFSKIFALSKHNIEWFLKQGFVQAKVDDLPKNRQNIFDYHRNSSVFFKEVNYAD